MIDTVNTIKYQHGSIVTKLIDSIGVSGGKKGLVLHGWLIEGRMFILRIIHNTVNI